MPRTKAKVHTPGEQPGPDGAEVAPVAPKAKPKRAAKPKVDDVDGPDADTAQSNAALAHEVAQLKALVQQLIESGRAVADPEAPKTAPAKLIGDDLRPMTSKQVQAAIASGQIVPQAGRPVMTADGYLCL